MIDDNYSVSQLWMQNQTFSTSNNYSGGSMPNNADNYAHCVHIFGCDTLNSKMSSCP